MMALKLKWLFVFSVALLSMGGKPITGSHSRQVAEPSEVVIRQNRLTKSLKTWRRLKAKYGDHYRYEIAQGFYLGWGAITTVTVKKGSVVARTYEEGQTNNKGELTVEKQYSWTEKGAGVGSHSGAAPRTVDELYRECRDNVLTRNPRAHDSYLDIGSDGVLRSCVYGFKGFAMDTYPGVRIDALEFLPVKDSGY